MSRFVSQEAQRLRIVFDRGAKKTAAQAAHFDPSIPSYYEDKGNYYPVVRIDAHLEDGTYESLPILQSSNQTFAFSLIWGKGKWEWSKKVIADILGNTYVYYPDGSFSIKINPNAKAPSGPQPITITSFSTNIARWFQALPSNAQHLLQDWLHGVERIATTVSTETKNLGERWVSGVRHIAAVAEEKVESTIITVKDDTKKFFDETLPQAWVDGPGLFFHNIASWFRSFGAGWSRFWESPTCNTAALALGTDCDSIKSSVKWIGVGVAAILVGYLLIEGVQLATVLKKK
jgi:hypothetical protein